MIRFLKGTTYIEYTMFAIVMIMVFRYLFIWAAVPYEFERFLFFEGKWWEPIIAAWPVFIVGIILNTISLSSTTNSQEVHKNAKTLPLSGFFTSLTAGVLEEVSFRWVLLYFFMGIYWIIDTYLLGGALQNVLSAELLLLNSIITLGNSDIILGVGGWSVGLAILSSNWKFQEGHIYQGTTGRIFSWFAGIFFFSVTFRYGLLASMFVHFLFDMLIFVMLMIDIAIEKLRGVHNATNKIYKWY